MKRTFTRDRDPNKTPHQTIPLYYYMQVNLCLECANREWCDYISWSPARAVTVSVLSFRRPPSSRRGEALSEREAAGSGSLGAASFESAAGIVRLLGCGC